MRFIVHIVAMSRNINEQCSRCSRHIAKYNFKQGTLNNMRFNPHDILIFTTFGRAVHRKLALNSLYVLYPRLFLLRISHADCRGQQSCHLANISWQAFNLDDPQTFSACNP